jgi:pimeloyl-ACP methyl ester carboxylesterase
LIEALGLAPAAVFRNSSGAIIDLDLVIRHPDLVRGAILHKLPMMSTLSRPEEVMVAIQEVVEGGMAKGGPRGAVEAFVRFVAGDETFANLDPRLRELMLNNVETLFSVEFGAFESYRPDNDSLAAIEVPVRSWSGPTALPSLASQRAG